MSMDFIKMKVLLSRKKFSKSVQNFLLAKKHSSTIYLFRFLIITKPVWMMRMMEKRRNTFQRLERDWNENLQISIITLSNLLYLLVNNFTIVQPTMNVVISNMNVQLSRLPKKIYWQFNMAPKLDKRGLSLSKYQRNNRIFLCCKWLWRRVSDILSADVHDLWLEILQSLWA